MNEIFLHNTLTGKKEAIHPIVPGQFGMYVCGITPYDETHVGHARCYVVFDTLKRVLQKENYRVTHIQNFTDIDDKIIDRAKQLGVSPSDHAEKYISRFNEAMTNLHVLSPDKTPRVTTHIPEILELISQLVKKGVAYESEGDVFFAVRKFPGYGNLSKRKLEDLQAGTRVEINEAKKDPFDFALWKKAKEGEPMWDSPWGKGRPGWHIECSAMSMKYLGAEFDLHGGGLDLIFPHHENEIAQSVGATGKKFAHLWVHNGFVTVNEEKMSKSLGNFFTLKDIFAKYTPMAVRYFLLTQHYRSPLNFSDKELTVSAVVWERISEAVRVINLAQGKNGKTRPPLETKVQQEVKTLNEEFTSALRDDLNTAKALGAFHPLLALVFKTDGHPGVAESFLSMMDVLGLAVTETVIDDPEAHRLVEERRAARANKDWAASDRIRDALQKKGYAIEDTPQGARLKKLP